MTDTPAQPIKYTVNSAALARVVTDQLMLKTLIGQHGLGERGHVPTGRGCGRDGVEIPCSLVQKWFDERALTLRPEPETEQVRKIYGSPRQFLIDNGLTAPLHKDISPPTLPEVLLVREEEDPDSRPLS